MIPADWTNADLKTTDKPSHGTVASVSDLMHARTIVDGLLRRQKEFGQEVPCATDPGVSGSIEPTGGSMGGTRRRRTKRAAEQARKPDRKGKAPRRGRGGKK